MPKGYNADGSKKVRPPESGRKPKPSKQIAPQISLEAATVLTALKKQKINQNTFISEAILEKAEREAARKATRQTEPGNAGQVDLVDMIQEIKTQRVVKIEEATPERIKADGTLLDLFKNDLNELPAFLQPIQTAESTELDIDTIHVPAIPTEEFTVQATIVSIEEPTPAVFIEDTSEMNKLDYQTERRKTAYAGMLKRVDEFGVGSIGVETVLARIMRIRRRGRVDALEVLTECHNLGLCTNNGTTVGIPGKE